MEDAESPLVVLTKIVTFRNIVLQILIIDLVFSIDSVITAVGMTDQISIMIATVVISMLIMMSSATSLSDFVDVLSFNEYIGWYDGLPEKYNRITWKIDQVRGMSPWILVHFKSPERNLPMIQDGWNRKGLISDDGIKKKAFFILQDFYLRK